MSDAEKAAEVLFLEKPIESSHHRMGIIVLRSAHLLRYGPETPLFCMCGREDT